MQRIEVNLTDDCDGNQLNYSNDLPAIRNKNYALQKPFETDFLTLNRQRHTPTVIRHLLSSTRQPNTLWPKASDFAFTYFFM